MSCTTVVIHGSGYEGKTTTDLAILRTRTSGSWTTPTDQMDLKKNHVGPWTVCLNIKHSSQANRSHTRSQSMVKLVCDKISMQSGLSQSLVKIQEKENITVAI